MKEIAREVRCNPSTVYHYMCKYGIKRRGGGAKKARVSVQDYRELAEFHDLEWIDPEYPPNSSAPTEFKCKTCGHQWKIRYDTLCLTRKKGRKARCYGCGGYRKTETDFHDLARSKGINWTSPELPHAISAKTQWMCKEGHVWEAPYHRVLYSQFGGCPYCNGNAPKTPADYYALAEKYDLLWLGPVVSRTRNHTTWQCKKRGHKWGASYNNLSRKSDMGLPRCPECRHLEYRGESHPSWLGGKYSDPYGPKFNDELKDLVRERDDHTCKLCHAPEDDKKLHVHHIDHDKANNSPGNLVTLCSSCHGPTNAKRDAWQWLFNKCSWALE